MRSVISILQINTLDNKGGAAKSAYRLNTALNRAKEFRSNMAVGVKFSNDDSVKCLGYRKLINLAKGRDNIYSLLMPSFSALKRKTEWDRTGIVHLHNVHSGYFNPTAIRHIAKEKPTIWTLHDPWTIFESGKVPEYNQIFTSQRVSRLIRAVKKNQLPKVVNHIVFTTPSQWLKEKFLEVHPTADVRHIPNHIDTKIFYPTKKSSARKILGLDQEKFIILLVADSGEDNATKGADTLDRITRNNSSVMKLVIGKGKRYINDEAQLALYYSAADLFVFPSKAENFPLVTLEAMACGTPVVAYDVGGVSEQVEHMVNGCLVESGDETGLAKQVEKLIADPKLLARFAKKSLERTTRMYNENRVIEQYIKLYHEIGSKDPNND